MNEILFNLSNSADGVSAGRCWLLLSNVGTVGGPIYCVNICRGSVASSLLLVVAGGLFVGTTVVVLPSAALHVYIYTLQKYLEDPLSLHETMRQSLRLSPNSSRTE